MKTSVLHPVLGTVSSRCAKKPSREPWRGQLPTQSCVQRFAWHICYLLC